MVLLPSCKDDDDFVDNALQYDGDNQNAPVFEVGTSIAAAYFPTSYVSNYTGKKIEKIEFYIRDVPAETIIRVQKDGSNAPGEILYELDVTNDVNGNSWNQIVFTNSADFIELTGDAIWLTLEVKHNNPNEQSVGCDSGPANANGDWIFSDTDNEWKTYRNRTNNAVDINWNIRAVLID